MITDFGARPNHSTGTNTDTFTQRGGTHDDRGWVNRVEEARARAFDCATDGDPPRTMANRHNESLRFRIAFAKVIQAAEYFQVTISRAPAGFVVVQPTQDLMSL